MRGSGKILLAAVLLSGPAALAVPPSLLSRAKVQRTERVKFPERLIDGVAPIEGDGWLSQYTSVIEPSGFVEWDLGEVVDVRAGWLQADNNDSYVLAISEDGTQYTALWTAGPVPSPGMRERRAPSLAGRGRFLRLSAEGGDKMFSVGEVELFAAPEDLARSAVKREFARADIPPINTDWVWLGAVVAGFAYLFWNNRNLGNPKPS